MYNNITHYFSMMRLNNLVFVFALVILLFGMIIKGSVGNGLQQASLENKPGLAFEDSIARGRYALVLSLVQHNSFIFSTKIANFAAPDVSFSQGKYFSIFPPGVAFFAMPFYLLGSIWSVGQLAVSMSQVTLTLLNGLLLFVLMRKLGGGQYTSALSSILFLITSNSMAYSNTLNQHQLTTLILVTFGLLVVSKEEKYRGIYAVVCYACSPLIDWPNLVLFFPFFIYIFWQEYLQMLFIRTISVATVKRLVLVSIFSLLPFVVYATYNIVTTSRPTQIAQLLPSPKKEDIKKVYVKLPFRLEKIPRGIHVLLFSFERGLFVYFPIFALSVFSVGILLRTHRTWSVLSLLTVVANILLYAMFGDVWGGLAFGPRYLIPSIAILSIYTAAAYTLWSKHFWFQLLFCLSAYYSLSVAVLGAVTTILIPKSLTNSTLYTYIFVYPFEHIRDGQLGSFVYRTLFKNWVTNEGYFLLVLVLAACIFSYVLFRTYTERGEI